MFLSKLSEFLKQFHPNPSFMLLLGYLYDDMKKPFSYLLVGIIIAAAFLVIMIFVNTAIGREPIPARYVYLFLFIAYLIVLAQMVYFNREPGSRTSSMNLTLFSTWGSTMKSHAYVIENVLLFIPFGIFVPACFPKLRGISNVFCLAVILSTTIELLQYFTGRGFCQLDDVVTNTLGALIGFVIYFIVHGIHNLFR